MTKLQKSKLNLKKRKADPQILDSIKTISIKWTLSIVFVALIPIFLYGNTETFLQKLGFKKVTQDDALTISNSSSVNLGGWRNVSALMWKKYGSNICRIERVSIVDLPVERFESEFRFKKPVLVTFPNGAADWTHPVSWSRAGLIKAYSGWKIRSGESLEIVRKGGNAKDKSSFKTFLDELLGEDDDVERANNPGSYAFDRRFYWESDLPKTLKLPEFFEVNETTDESIFFLGASATGVVFHKHSDTWNAVVYGRKRWFLYPTTHTPPGGVFHGFTLLDWVNKVYPQLPEKEKPIECIQQAGEILYLPEGTYHATLNLGDTIAFAIQKINATLPTETMNYEATDLEGILSEEYSDASNQTSIDEVHKRLIEVYERMHQMLPENSEIMYKYGEKLLEMGKVEESLQWHQKALEMDPFFILARLNLAKTLARLNRHEEAIKEFEEAIDLSPNLWDNYKEYGMYLYNKKSYQLALSVLKKGTDLRPDTIPFWYYIKQCQLELGDEKAAEATNKIIVDLKVKDEIENMKV